MAAATSHRVKDKKNATLQAQTRPRRVWAVPCGYPWFAARSACNGRRVAGSGRRRLRFVGGAPGRLRYTVMIRTWPSSRNRRQDLALPGLRIVAPGRMAPSARRRAWRERRGGELSRAGARDCRQEAARRAPKAVRRSGRTMRRFPAGASRPPVMRLRRSSGFLARLRSRAGRSRHPRPARSARP